jgi:hypothetical protein
MKTEINYSQEILKFQSKIFKLIHPQNGVSVHFRFDPYTGLDLVTYNGKNDEFFLLKHLNVITSDIGKDNQEYNMYLEMFEYVKHLVTSIEENKGDETIGYSFTVIWSRKDGPSQTSYFYGKDVEDILKKFYYGKEGVKHLFIIYDIKMNPLS